MGVIGYARVSTGEQTLDPQLIELRDAGCERILEEYASGGSRTRPVLAQLMRDIRPGDTLVVVRLDRLARSLSHLLTVIEDLEKRGAHFRSIRDPIDSASPQGKFALQVLGAAAELERSLIRDRTVAGLKSARAQGRIGGNPGLRNGDASMQRRLATARLSSWLDNVQEGMDQWAALVRRHRPEMAWEDVLRLVNGSIPRTAAPWTEKRLRRAVQAMVDQGLIEKSVMQRAPRREKDDRLLTIVAAVSGSDVDMTLENVAARLEQMRVETPRGRHKWSKSSVKHQIDKARAQKLIV